MPRFVAEDLTKIPFVNVDSISVLSLTKKLESHDSRLSTVERFLGKCTLHVDEERLPLAVDDSATTASPVHHDSQNTDISTDTNDSVSVANKWTVVVINRRRRRSNFEYEGRL